MQAFMTPMTPLTAPLTPSERGDVELGHREHRLGGPLRFLRVRIADHVDEHNGDDLPGQPVLVLQPATGHFPPTLGELAPVVIHLARQAALAPPGPARDPGV